MHFKSDSYKTDIITTVKGIGFIQIEPSANIIGIPNEGHLVFSESASTSIVEDPTWVYYDALAVFGIQGHAIRNKIVKCSGLEGTLEGSITSHRHKFYTSISKTNK